MLERPSDAVQAGSSTAMPNRTHASSSATRSDCCIDWLDRHLCGIEIRTVDDSCGSRPGLDERQLYGSPTRPAGFGQRVQRIGWLDPTLCCRSPRRSAWRLRSGYGQSRPSREFTASGTLLSFGWRRPVATDDQPRSRYCRRCPWQYRRVAEKCRPTWTLSGYLSPAECGVHGSERPKSEPKTSHEKQH
jgi:hypothetical protein